jgi:ataxia telangiectasia mutated family protein
MATRHRLSDQELAQLSHDFACFAADEQQHARTNGELETLRGYRDRKRDAVDKLDPAIGGNRRESKSFKETRHERQQSLERESVKVERLEAHIDVLTKHALRMYALALKLSDRFDDSITRMCSIWLAHTDPNVKGTTVETEANAFKRAETIAKAFASALEGIPTHKFIFLGPQLAARLYRSKVASNFNSQLNSLLLRLSKEHPYHILYQIIPLASGVDIGNLGAKGRRNELEMEGRAAAAAGILQILDVDQTHTLARTASQHMRRYAEAATPWCLTPPPEEGGRGVHRPLQIPRHIPLVNLPKPLDIPVPTVIPPVRPNRDYSDVPKFARFSTYYQVLGGLHRPKKMKCYDELGGAHHQLFKGDDEIRQDAVMEQVFDMTNDILRRDRQTRQRRLRFRTYVVIPLADKTGILEFVAEGLSIGDWLKPAHERYRRKEDITSTAFRDAIRSIQDRDFNSPTLVTKWQELLPRFPPVMRHFFREKQSEPMGWFDMRLKYARSVAVTSMVGHMLGIGDRHLSNIMIDETNGEVIHIDFGIVFEEVSPARHGSYWY